MGRAEAETTLRGVWRDQSPSDNRPERKDFVIDVGQVIYQHRTIVCAWTREVSSIRPICASPGQSASVSNSFLPFCTSHAMPLGKRRGTDA